MKSTFLPAIVFLATVLLLGCKSAKVTGEREYAPVTANKPAMVYVEDFDLDAGNIQQSGGVLSNRPGPLGRLGNRLYGTSDDPQAEAGKLVKLMSDSIVKDLNKAGFNTVRLAPGVPPPSDGWLVRGVFVTVQEGNRLRRAVIGFGSGATDLQVVTFVDDLSQGPPKPLYEMDTDAASGKSPGAAPFIKLSPYGIPVRFVMAKNDLDKNVKQTATQIANNVSQRVKQKKPGS
jgi:hypothetical protein